MSITSNGVSAFMMGGEIAAAEQRALATLKRWLTPAQREELAQTGAFTVKGSNSGDRYTISTGLRFGNVKRCRRIRVGLLGLNVRVEEPRYCATTIRLPIPDQALIQKLMIENDEKEFLRVANQTGLIPF